jgi:hypothetical protein
MWGAFSSYLISHVAGLDQHAQSYGYTGIRMTPGAMPGSSGGGGLSAASASLALKRGEVEFAWQWIGGEHCATGAEGSLVMLACGAGGGVITEIIHTSYGAPQGMCGAFKPGKECDHPGATAAVASLCLGQSVCSVPVDAAGLGTSDAESCALDGHMQRLHVQVVCSAQPQLVASVVVPVSSQAMLELPTAAYHTHLLLQSNDATDTPALLWDRGSKFSGGATSMDSMPQGVEDVRLEEDGTLAVAVGSGAYSFVLQ